MSNIAVIAFLSVFFAVGFGLLGYAFRSLYVARAAGSWPTVEGQVIQSELSDCSDSEGSSYVATVKYRYTVAGSRYEGDRIAFGYSSSSGREAHAEIAERLRAAKTVTVRYHPSDPSRSVLCHGMNRSIMMLFVFATTWLCFVSGFAAVWLIMSQGDTGILRTLLTTQ